LQRSGFAEQYHAAQERGEVAKAGQPRIILHGENNSSAPATAEELGIDSKDIFRGRQISKAQEANPDFVRQVVDKQLAAGEEPSWASLIREIEAAITPRKEMILIPLTKTDQPYVPQKIEIPLYGPPPDVQKAEPLPTRDLPADIIEADETRLSSAISHIREAYAALQYIQSIDPGQRVECNGNLIFAQRIAETVLATLRRK
jgi:hypothetical protein